MVLASIEDTIAAALRGDVVSFPTDTVPALAVMANCADRIYQLKGRSRLKPLILMGASIDSLRPYVVNWHPAWQAEIEQGWPGPLTLVLPASDRVPSGAISAGDSVGIRIPAFLTAQKILQATGPLATTSANISGSAPLTSPEQIDATFPTVTVLDCPFPVASTPSTVARWSEAGQSWEILRQGAYQLSD